MNSQLIISLLKESGNTVEEAMVFPEREIPYWHSTVIDPAGNPIASGFGSDKAYARKVAISEFLERKFFREICAGPREEQIKWGLDKISTACGFAGGFDQKNAIIRSLGEAAERWVMSKWIDEGFRIDEIPAEAVMLDLDPVSKFLAGQFEKVLYFKKTVQFMFGNLPLKVEVAQTMGIAASGIYPGSSAQYLGGSIWQHSLLESFRHLLFVRNNPKRLDRFPDNKIHFFAKNADIALEAINKATTTEWPDPKILFQFDQKFLGGDYFLARTIFEGWESWEEGPLERFLY